MKKEIDLDTKIEDSLIENIKKQTYKLRLDELENKYLDKISLLTSEMLSLVIYYAGMPYLQKSLKYLLNENAENALKNPFIKILIVFEGALVNNFILLFANLFTYKSVKEDTFSILSIVKEFAQKKDGKVVITDKFPKLIKNNFETREALKQIFTFFEDKENKRIIEYMVELRNHIVAHPTIKRETNLEKTELLEFKDFMIKINDTLYKMLGLWQMIDFQHLYDEEVSRWMFYYESIMQYGSLVLSDEFTNQILNSYEDVKKRIIK